MILAGALDPDAEKPEKWRKLLMRFPFRYMVPGSFRPSNEELWFLKEDLILLREQLDQLRQNVLVIHGTEDKLVPFENVSFMKRAFTGVANLKIIPLEKERHFIVWDREALIKSTLMDSISSFPIK